VLKFQIKSQKKLEPKHGECQYNQPTPFADYWPIWSDVDVVNGNYSLVQGEFGYPPSRQTPISKKMIEFDPSIIRDVSSYVELSYNGTWSMFVPPNNSDRVIKLLSKHLLGL
jgi:hypothetical protein